MEKRTYTTPEKIAKSRLEELKKKHNMVGEPDKEFLEWWRRNHGTGYAIEIEYGK